MLVEVLILLTLVSQKTAKHKTSSNLTTSYGQYFTMQYIHFFTNPTDLLAGVG